MKVCIKRVFEDKIRKNNSLHFVQGSFHQGNVLLFPTTAGRQCPCMAMLAIVYSVFKHVNSKDLYFIKMIFYFKGTRFTNI